ncbi:MAG: enoyl-CoA hydratase/isomerase family protein [Salinirussus sp.]
MPEIGSGLTRLEINDHRADVILNRPEKRNALTESLMADLIEALEIADADEDVRAIALLGEGPVLCAGMDLDMMRERGEQGRADLEPGIEDVTATIDDLAVPTVAGIKGAAVAGGFELVLPVDFRIIDAEAAYGVIEVRLGTFPSGGSTQRLPRLVGLSKAKELVLTGDLVDPAEAERIGLVHEVVEESGTVDDRARSWADDLAANAPLGMQRARRMLNVALDTPLEEGLELERALGKELVHTDDYDEGFAARRADREPEFEGR